MRNLLVVVVVTVVIGLPTAVGLEWWARGKFGTVCTQPHPVFHHQFIPKVTCHPKTPEFEADYEINALGLRDREVTIPKPNDEYRMLMLGDSFTEGQGVKQNETFSYLLERSFEKNGRNVRVINAGISANSPLLEYLWIQTIGWGLQPDLVILNVNEVDLSEEKKYQSLAVWVGDEIVSVPGKPLEYLPPFLSSWLRQHSSFYGWFTARVVSKVIAWKATIWQSKPNAMPINGGGIFSVSKGVFQADFDKLWSPFKEDIIRINSQSKVRRVPLVLVAQPFGHHVSPTAWTGRTRQKLEMGKVYDSEFYTALATLGYQLGLPVVDLRPAFVANNSGELFYANDGHWTKYGHMVVANALADFLQTVINL